MAAPVWLARTRAAFWTTCWPALKRDGESFGADKVDRKRLSTIIRTWPSPSNYAADATRHEREYVVPDHGVGMPPPRTAASRSGSGCRNMGVILILLAMVPPTQQMNDP